MAKTRQRKESEVQAFLENLRKAKATIFVRYAKLTVADERNLRSLLRKEGNRYTVVKKTLLAKALRELKIDDTSLAGMTGSIAAAFGLEDEVSVARVIHTFGKQNEAVQMVGGIYNGEVLSQESVKQLALLPTKDELKAKLVFIIASPLRGLVSVLQGPMRGMVQALSEIQKQKSA